MLAPIGRRLFLSYLAVVAVGLLAAAVALAGLLVRYENEVTRQRLVESAAPFLTAAQQAIRQGGGPREIVQSLVEQARAGSARLLIVQTAQRRVVVDSDGTLEGQFLPPIQPNERDVGTFRQGGEEWIFVQRPLGPAGTVVVARQRAQFGDTLRALLPPLLWGAAAAAAFALLVAALLARTITHPLRDLASGVRRFASGHYRARVAVGGPSEVRELGGAFNEMADEVERARGSEQAFLADISHELRTPLTSIQGFSQAIVEGEVRGDGVGWAAKVIQRESRRLVRMVEGLLQVAKLEAGRERIARDAVGLEAVLDGALAAIAPQANETGVVIRPEIAPLPSVLGDADRLAQLFLNVLDNAVKHSPPGGIVEVRAAREDGAVVIRVRDSGSGLPAGGEGRLFERFYRGENAARDGAGLGLAIAQAIAEAHGGRIEARNAENGGAEFTVRLPVTGPGAP